jgi:outer membrane receptor protein involved in Fe transport
LYYLPQNGNQLFNTSAKMEQYVKSLRIKFSLQFSTVYASNRIIFNNVPSKNKMFNISLQQKAVTAFRNPVNLEAIITAIYVLNATVPVSGESSFFNLWQYQGYGKMKVRAGKKLYTALMYNYYILSPGNFFHTMDLYANLEVNKAWIISLTAHNLFNVSTIEQRQFSVNSIAEQRYELVGRYLLIKFQFTF